jgi:hypothetical protein
MKHLLKFQDAHAPRLFFGREENIRIAVLKDEVDLWNKRGYYITKLQTRIEELSLLSLLKGKGTTENENQ